MKNFKFKILNFKNKDAGFTLVELLVVVSIISLGFIFLLNLRSRVFLNETVTLVVADVRNIQFKALSSARHNGTIRCGYGIHDDYDDYDSYFIYTSADVTTLGVPPDCGGSEDRRYCTDAPNPQTESDEKLPVTERKLFHSSLEFKGGNGGSNFGPIFFEPPYPTTFLCSRLNNWTCPSGLGVVCDVGSTSLALPPTIITVGQVGKTCAQALCKSICVYTSGRIEVVDGALCP